MCVVELCGLFVSFDSGDVFCVFLICFCCVFMGVVSNV